jgi:predicted transcriptional regulator
MSFTRLQKQAKIDRGLACLKYMQKRIGPVTVKELAEKLKISPKLIQNALMPLLAEGKITRRLLSHQSSVAKKIGRAYGYNAVEIKLQNRNKPFLWNNPFGIQHEKTRTETRA